MSDVLAQIIVAVVMLGLVVSIVVPAVRLRGRSAWPELEAADDPARTIPDSLAH
jgi:hypothetical protein